jgi:hypothetical protein
MTNRSQQVPAQAHTPTNASGAADVLTDSSAAIASALVPLFRERPLAGDESAEEYDALLKAVVSAFQPVDIAD